MLDQSRFPDLIWRRPTVCESGSCVEIAVTEGAVLVRNSENPDTVVSFDHLEWRGFLAGVGLGEFAV